MASGRKNYFRHSFFARHDDLIMGMIDRFGYKGYFYWFVLVEICAEQCSDEMREFCKFHESTLYRELRCNQRSLKPVLDYLQTSMKLVYNYSDKFYQIQIVNLPKYMGKYTIKNPPNTPNKKKRKENKRKEKKVKEPGSCLLDFLDPESSIWLGDVSSQMMSTWLKEYTQEEISGAVGEAMTWEMSSSGKSWKNKALGVNNWLKRSYGKNGRVGAFKSKDDFEQELLFALTGGKEGKVTLGED